MRKLLSICLVVGLVFSSTVSSFAFGGYSHWYMAKKAGSGLSSTNQKYYASGCLLADLGKSVLDAYGYASDGLTVTNTMVSIANSSTGTTADKYFASGWKAHYVQDTQGKMSNITGGSTTYRIKCGWVDEYLRDYKGITCPINDTATMSVNYGLIKKVYKQLNNFDLGDTYIDGYIVDEFSLYNAQILLANGSWTSAERASIEAELTRTAGLCKTSYSATALSQTISDTTVENPSTISTEEDTQKITESKKAIKNKLDEIKNNDLVEIVKVSGEYEGVYDVTIVIKDSDKYNEKIKEIAEILKENDVTTEELF